ncbi:folate family ECF transporter S component [Eubacteriales bacterium OttesenSCG-928-N14]|nr:folate family ECF transporter S component [Eubacteriales bacterium OttesenSCG-928-N14]
MRMNVKERPAFAISIAGMLTAMSVLLTGPLSIPVNLFGGYIKNIGFGVLPVMYGGVRLGMAYGFSIGVAADILSFLIFPKGGGYFPGFSISYGLIGLLPALFLRKLVKPTFWKIFLAVIVTHLICSFGLNNLFLIVLYHVNAQVVLLRGIVQSIMAPVYGLLLYLLLGGKVALPKKKISTS